MIMQNEESVCQKSMPGCFHQHGQKTPFRIPFPAIHVQSHMARALQRLLAQASLVWLTMTSPNNDHLSSSTYLTTSNIYDISIADCWSLIYVLQCLVLAWILPCKISSSCLNSKHHWTFVKTIFLLSQSGFIILSLDYFQCIFSRLTSKLHEMLFFFQIHSQTQTIPGSDSQSFQVKQWHCEIILHSTHLKDFLQLVGLKVIFMSSEIFSWDTHAGSHTSLQSLQVAVLTLTPEMQRHWHARRWRWPKRWQESLCHHPWRLIGAVVFFAPPTRLGAFFWAEKRTARTTPPDSDGWNSW